MYQYSGISAPHALEAFLNFACMFFQNNLSKKKQQTKIETAESQRKGNF